MIKIECQRKLLYLLHFLHLFIIVRTCLKSIQREFPDRDSAKQVILFLVVGPFINAEGSLASKTFILHAFFATRVCAPVFTSFYDPLKPLIHNKTPKSAAKTYKNLLDSVRRYCPCHTCHLHLHFCFTLSLSLSVFLSPLLAL